MKTPSISLKRKLDVTIKDTYVSINKSGEKDSEALRDEYKEWLEASEGENKHPYSLYMNHIKPNSYKRALKKGLSCPLTICLAIRN